MLTVFFEAHATSLDNEAQRASGHYDVELSRRGEEQAREMGQRYGQGQLAAVYCSDLRRSYRTAELAFGDRGIPIIRDARLRECDYGDWTRRPRREIEAIRADRIDEPFPHGESYRQVAQRVRSFLRERQQESPQDTILVVGHRATQYALEHWANKIPLEKAVTAAWSWQPGWKYRLDSL